MRKFAILLAAIGVLLPALLTTPAGATAFRTFVSNTGTDTGTCPRSNPCATFAYALTQTAGGGEVNCLNAGDYAGGTTVLITFAVTISCEAGTAGAVFITNITTLAINAAATDDVTLRGLDISGLGTGNAGVYIQNARSVHIENCAFRGFRFNSSSTAIYMAALPHTIFLYVTDSVISGNSNGLLLDSTGGYKVVSLKNVTITGQTGDGVLAYAAGVFVNITQSVISGNGGNAIRIAVGGSEVNIDRTTIANNATALLAGAAGATIRAIGNNIFNNTYAFGIAGGATIATDGQNRSGGNVFAQDANASVTLK